MPASGKPSDQPDPAAGDEATVDLSEARALVLGAFALARETGRDDWRKMTVAVLKNRLLDMTERRFDESQWGASTMREFVALVEDLLRLDTSSRPAAVVLRDHVDVETPTSETTYTHGGWRIRPDLWDAVMDFGSGNVYVWDGRSAVRMPAGEVDADDTALLPTVTSADLTAWRERFVSEVLSGAGHGLSALLEEWQGAGQSSRMLPVGLRNRWYGSLKRHVRARLEEWFAERAEPPPDDWVLAIDRSSARPAADTEHLRTVLIRALGTMTRDELESLSLPASVLARLTR